MNGSIINYGTGNISSIKNILNHFDIKNKLTNEKLEIRKSDFLILPGVGSFPYVIKKIKNSHLFEEIFKHTCIKKKPIIGICLGMQLFFSESNENEKIKGLNYIKGNVVENKKKKKFSSPINIGWSNLKMIRKNPILNGITEKDFFYFLHSFNAKVDKKNNNLIAREKRNRVTAIIKKQNILGLQFHPEKSGKAGLKIFENFLNMMKKNLI